MVRMRRRAVASFIASFVALGGVVTGATRAYAITPAANLTALSSNPGTTPAGAFSLPVNAIPSQAFATNASNNPSPVESIGVGHTGVGHTGVGHTGVGHTGVGHTGVGHTGIARLALGQLGVGHTGVGHTDVVGAAMQNILITDLPIWYPHGCDDPASTTPCTGWEGVLAGTALAALPRQTITMKDVILDSTALARFNSLQLSDLDLSKTSLTNLPLAAVALSGIPISQLSLDGNFDPAHTFQNWCDTLSNLTTGVDCLADLGVDPTTITSANVATVDDITLLTLAFAGVDFSVLPLAAITVTGDVNTPRNVLGTSPLGVASVGTANIPGFSPDVTLADIGVGHTGVGHTGVGHTGVGHTGVGHTDIANLGVGHTGVGHTDLNAAGVGHTGVGHTGVGHTGVGHTAVGTSGPGAVPLGLMVLGDTSGPIGIGKFLLADLDLAAAGLADIPLSDLGTNAGSIVQCTVFDCTTANATLGSVGNALLQPNATLFDLSNALVANSASAVAFAGLRSGPIIGALLPGTTEGDTVTFADYIGQINAFNSSTLDTPPYQMTLADFFAQADQVVGTDWTVGTAIDDASTTLEIHGTTAPPAGAFTVFGGSELMNVTAAVDHGDGTQTWTVTRGLNGSTAVAHAVGIPVFGGADVELGVLLSGLSVADQDRTTLEELFGALPPDILNGTNLGELLSAIASATGITLDDLLLALLGQQDLPWEQLDIGSVNLQTYASPQTLITFTGTLVVNGDGPQDIEANATIPADFAYVPGSSSLGGTPVADPAVSSSSGGQQLKWTLLQVPVGTSSLTFQLEPGTALGTETVSAEAHLRSVGTANPTVSSDVAVTNTAPSAASTDSNNPTTMSPDTLYLGHVSAGQTSNFFQLTIAGGQRVSLLLGNLPADYDLILYDASGAAVHLRLSPSGSVIPVSDPAPSLTPAQDSLPTETLQDLPLVAGRRVYDVSANRGLKDEEIDTGTLPAGQYLVQVAGYNGASSDLPYSLRARITNDAAATCPGTHTFQFPTDQAPAFTPPAPSAAVDTVVLMDPNRLAQTWGAAAVQPVWKALTAFMNAYGKAQLVSVEDNQATRDAYTAWDADPCGVAGANGVVTAIGAQLDALLAQNPNIKFVTVVGGDDQIPMARLRDATRIANERGRAPDFSNAANALASVFSGGFLLTDDVYAQQHPLAVAGRDLFVPDLQVGRLVDRPDEIAKAFSDFAAANGVLPASAKSLVTGYDFLSDGAHAVADALAAGQHNPDTSLINDTWTRDDLASKLLGAPSAGASSDPSKPIPNIASVNAHFDEQNILPAIGNTNKNASALFSLADAQAAGTRNGGTTLQGALLFSMGCHAGLNLPDAMATVLGRVGDTGDWSQFMAQQGALWIANTGFGYGDTDTVALSEKLMALLADQLDRSSTIGEALRVAKQRYRAALAVVSPYDEKVMEESTFYGLPQWSLGAPSSGPVVLPSTSGSAVDGQIAGLRSSDFSRDFDPNGVGSAGVDPLHFVTNPGAPSPAGHYEVNGQTLVASQRPIQPRYEFDVSPAATDPTNLAGEVAKGTIITELHSQDTVGFLPDYSRPATDQSQNEHAQPVGDASFPAGLQSLTTYGHDNGLTQHVNVVPAQFRPTPGLAEPGRGTERLFTHFRAHVYYGPEGSDSVPPTILTSGTQVFNNTVTITAQVQDTGATDPVGNVKRVFALVSQSGAGAGTWFPIELHPSLSLTDAPGTWVGQFASLPAPNSLVDYYVQAADSAGNVGVSASKGAYFNAENLAPTGPLRFTFTGAQGNNGWFTSNVSVKITPPAVTQLRKISYSIDGGKTITAPLIGPVTLPTFTDLNEGVHTIVAFQSGQQQSRAEVLIDKRAPSPLIGAPTSAAPSDGGWYNDSPHKTSIVPNDPGQFGSGVATITYSARGATTIASKTVPQPAVGSPPVSENITNDGVTTFNVSATDRAGNTALPATDFAVGVDSHAPTLGFAASPIANPAHWHKSVPAVTITASDAAPSSGATRIVYTVNGQSPATPPALGTPVQVATDITPGASSLQAVVDSSLLSEGHNVISATAFDDAGNSSGQTTVNVNVDLTPPSTAASVVPAENAAGWERANTAVTFTGTDPLLADGTTGSGVATVTYSAAKDAVKGGAIVSTTDVSGTAATYTLSTEGITTFTFHSTDVAGNVEPVAKTRVVKLDKTPPVINLAIPGTNTTAPVGPQANDPATGAPIPVYLLNQSPVRVTYSCSDPMSGLVTGLGGCSGSDGPTAKASLAQLDTNTLGMHSFSVQSTDVAGNTSSKTYQYRVVYNLCLQYDPTKPSNIGSAFPMKIQLCNAAGTILSSASITLTAVAADNNGALLSPNQAGSTGNNFSFTASSKVYQYNLKTDSRFLKTPNKNWLNFRVTSDPATPVGSATDAAYLNKLYRAYFLLK